MKPSHVRNILLGVVVALVGWGIFFSFTLSSVTSLQVYGNTYGVFLRQMLVGVLPAIVAGFIAYFVPLSIWRKAVLPLVVLTLLALFVVFIPGIGVKAGGASRWINIFGVNFQPSEFLKVAAILYLAAWIASKLYDTKEGDWKHSLKTGYHNIISVLLPFLVFLGAISFALFLQKDVSTLGIISLTLLAMYFSSRTPIWHTLVIVGLGIASLGILVKLEPYRIDRWMVFLNPDHDPLGKGFQVKQSLIALGSGGFWGKGLGMSVQKYGNVPEALTDSIFAIIGEELGFIGCVVLIGLFVALFLCGLYLYRHNTDTFSKLTAIGIVFWITIQALINMSSSAGLFPLAGIPLPFFSYGGSHMVVEMIGVGLLLNIAKNT